MIFKPAPEVKERINRIVRLLGWDYIDLNKVIAFESRGTKSNYVHARCWSFPRIWQIALNMEARYIIEVVGERYEKLNDENKDKLLIHELLHIPKTFSGALRPHKGYINNAIINRYYNELKQKENSQGSL